MKRIICILLAVVLCAVLFCSCEETENNKADVSSAASPFLAARTFSEGEGAEWTFDNTYYKLTHDKKLTIGYIGGSVTVGTGSTEDECWRAYTTKWFEENYPNAQVTPINSGYGGTSSLWGLARLQKMILDLKPDLIFIEFSINDLYNNIEDGQSAALMEGFIRKIHSYSPYCDIVILSVVDNQTIKSQSLNAKRHGDIAKYYGISWLDMGVPLNAAMQETGKQWADFASDSVHPNMEGYKIYGDYVKEHLELKLKESKDRNPQKLVEHTLPEKPYTSNSAMKAQTVWCEDIPVDSQIWKQTNTKEKKYGATAIRGRTDATLDFEFSGSFIAMFGAFKRSQLECYLDGDNKRTIGYNNDELGELILYDNLDPNVKHTLSITVHGTQTQITAFLIG